MDIRPDPSSLDALTRQRANERAARERQSTGGTPATNSGRPADADVELASTVSARFVEIVKTMDPTDLHRVEDIRQRIADGSYTATADELVDPLLEALTDAGQ